MFVLRHTPNTRSFVFLRSFLFSNSRNFSNKLEQATNDFDEPEDPEEIAAREAEIEKKRNKSKLIPEDYDIQNDTVKFTITKDTRLIEKREAYGKLGEASGVNPSLLWPTKDELDLMKDYERVLQPLSLKELIEKNKEEKRLKEENIKKLEEECLRKVANINNEIIEFHKRYAQKKAKAEELNQKKQKLIEQVRRSFGYNISTKDERFKAMLLELQEKDRKKLKADKKAAKAEIARAKVQAQLKKTSESILPETSKSVPDEFKN